VFFQGGVALLGQLRRHYRYLIFTDLPDNWVLDSNAPTTRQIERLLNANVDLEIHKYVTGSSVTKSTLDEHQSIGVADVQAAWDNQRTGRNGCAI